MDKGSSSPCSTCGTLLTFQYLCEQVGVVLVVEGRVPAEQDVGDDADAPDVDGLPVRLLGEDLGGNVTWA